MGSESAGVPSVMVFPAGASETAKQGDGNTLVDVTTSDGSRFGVIVGVGEGTTVGVPVGVGVPLAFPKGRFTGVWHASASAAATNKLLESAPPATQRHSTLLDPLSDPAHGDVLSGLLQAAGF